MGEPGIGPLASPLFWGVGEEELPELLQRLGAVTRSYPGRGIIFAAAGPVDNTGILLAGRAQVWYEDIFGNRSILGVLEPGDLFGEAFSCAGVERLPVSVVAQEDCEVLLVDIRRILEPHAGGDATDQRLLGNLARILAGKNVMLNQKIRYLSKRTTREKLLAYLSDQAEEAGSRRFTIPFQRQELADFLCVERSAMSAELGRLKREGVLDFHRSQFQLLASGGRQEQRPGG